MRYEIIGSQSVAKKKLEVLCIFYLLFAWIFTGFHPLNIVSIDILLLLMGLLYFRFSVDFCSKCHISLDMTILTYQLIFLEKLSMQIFFFFFCLELWCFPQQRLNFLSSVHGSTHCLVGTIEFPEWSYQMMALCLRLHMQGSLWLLLLRVLPHSGPQLCCNFLVVL